MLCDPHSTPHFMRPVDLLVNVYLHSMLAASIHSRSPRSNNDNSLSVPGVKTNTGARALHSCIPPLWSNLRSLSVQPVQLLPLRNIWRYISLIWPFPHRYHHSPWPVDVTELFPRFCYWTMMWLSRHWAWLCLGYWHYRSLIDWLKMGIQWQLSRCVVCVNTTL